MKQIYLVVRNTVENIHQDLLDVGSLDLIVDGVELSLDAGSKIEIEGNELSVNLVSFEEIGDWENLPFIQVSGEVWIDTEYPFEDLYAYLVVIENGSTRIFDLDFV